MLNRFTPLRFRILPILLCLFTVSLCTLSAQSQTAEPSKPEIQSTQDDPDSDAAFDQSMAHLDKRMAELNKKMAEMNVKIDKNVKEKMKNLDKKLPELRHALAALEHIDIPVPHIPAIPAIPPIPKAHKGINKDFDGPKVSEKIQKTFNVKEGTALSLDCNFSGIEIIPTTGGSTITVSLEKTAGAESVENASALLKIMKVSIEQTEKNISISSKIENQDGSGKKQNKQMFYMDIKISAPAGTPVTLKNSFGDVSLQGMGNVSGKNQFGSTALSELKGTLDIESKFGTLNITRQTGEGTVHSEFGALTIDGWTGKLSVDNKYGETKIQNVSDNAQIEGDFSFGKVHVTLPKNYSGRIEANTNMGNIEAPKELAVKKDFTNQSVKGTLGDGKGSLRLNAKFSPVIIGLE